MQNTFANITARSEKEAMEWSLVLASQGIEASIHHAPESGRWLLVVPSLDYERARAAIRLYYLENRRRVWQQEFRGMGLLFDWRGAFCLLMLAGTYAIGEAYPGFKLAGIMDKTSVLEGEWWRLFTAMTLHGDLAHLTANITTGAVLLGLAMGGYGPGIGLLAAFLAGAIGNVTGILLYEAPYRNVGASGMIMGALGLLTVYSLAFWREHPKPAQLVGRGVLGGILLLVLLGFSPGTDVIAHVGGFFGGCLLGVVLAFLTERTSHGVSLNRWSALICGALVVVSWLFALASTRRVDLL